MRIRSPLPKNRAPFRRGAALALIAAAGALLAAPAAAPAQSAQDVLQEAMERHRSRMEGIDNYTVVQTVMGFETTTYFEKRTVDGEPVFVPQTTMGSQAGEQVPSNPYRLYSELAERATHEGTEEVDGEACHVIAVTDFQGTELEAMGPGASSSAGNWAPDRMRMYVDADQYLPRKMTFEGTVAAQGEKRPASFTVHLRDYREVEGMMHPFRMETTAEGLGTQMSAEQQAQMRRSLQKMRRQMEQMSAQQRQMMERVMGGKMEKMEQMLSSGALDVTVQVKELRVNEGPPSGSS